MLKVFFFFTKKVKIHLYEGSYRVSYVYGLRVEVQPLKLKGVKGGRTRKGGKIQLAALGVSNHPH